MSTKNIDYDDLQDIVASSDTGGRDPDGFPKKLIAGVAIYGHFFNCIMLLLRHFGCKSFCVVLGSISMSFSMIQKPVLFILPLLYF